MERHGPTRSHPGPRGRWRLVAEDLSALAALSLLALVLGLVGNAWRHEPLPLRYQSLRTRLQAAVSTLSPANLSASRQVGQLSLATFQQAVAGRTALIVDARPDVFYRLGHVPTALNLSREAFAADYQRLRSRLEKAKDSAVIVYCTDPDCPDSAMVAAALLQLGFRQVSDVPAGWDAWEAAGLAEEKGLPP